MRYPLCLVALVATVAFSVCSCGGGSAPSAARSVTASSDAASSDSVSSDSASTDAASSDPSSVSSSPDRPATSLRALISLADELGAGWTDLGRQSESADVDDPLPVCETTMGPIHDAAPSDRLMWELTKLSAKPGFEDGHANVVIARVGAPVASAILDAAAQPDYAACAAATAVRMEEDRATGPGSAEPLDRAFSVQSAAWRATVPTGDSLFVVDTFFLASGPYIEKIRVTRCGCVPGAVDSASPLHPTEDGAIGALADRLKRLDNTTD